MVDVLIAPCIDIQRLMDAPVQLISAVANNILNKMEDVSGAHHIPGQQAMASSVAQILVMQVRFCETMVLVSAAQILKGHLWTSAHA